LKTFEKSCTFFPISHKCIEIPQSYIIQGILAQNSVALPSNLRKWRNSDKFKLDRLSLLLDALFNCQEHSLAQNMFCLLIFNFNSLNFYSSHLIPYFPLQLLQKNCSLSLNKWNIFASFSPQFNFASNFEPAQFIFTTKCLLNEI